MPPLMQLSFLVLFTCVGSVRHHPIAAAHTLDVQDTVLAINRPSPPCDEASILRYSVVVVTV